MAVHAGGRGPGHTSRKTLIGVFSPGGTPGATPSAPVLTKTSAAGVNPMSWQGSYTGLQVGDVLRLGWTRNGVAGVGDSRTITSDDVIFASEGGYAFSWPAFTSAAGGFVNGDVVVVWEYIDRAGTLSANSNTLSDTAAIATTAAINFGTANVQNRAFSSATFTISNVTFPTGRPTVLSFCNQRAMTSITLRPVGTGGSSDIALTNSQTHATQGNGRMTVWEAPAELASAAYDIIVTPAGSVDGFAALPCATVGAAAITNTATKAFGYSGANNNVTTTALTIPTDGVGVTLVYAETATGFAWNNGTEVFDASLLTGNARVGAARFTATATPSVNLEGTSANGSSMLAVAWSKA